MRLRLLPFLLCLFGAQPFSGLGQERLENRVAPIPEQLRAQFSLDDFYQKHILVGSLPVVGSKEVSDAAMREAAWIVQKLLGHRPEILQAMAGNRTRLAVMAYNEYTTDIPEHRHLESRVFWDRRARGLGATPSAPAVSCAEENLLGFPGDPYSTENICIHEFAHAIHRMGMPEVDPTFDERLKRAYREAMAAGLWKDTYAAVNRQEYWAEGVQSWFDDNRENDSLHNHVDTRNELKEYDAGLASLIEEVFGDRPWRYQKPSLRDPDQRAHLADFDFENAPRFQWRKEPVPDRPRISIQCPEGDIELELTREAGQSVVDALVERVHDGDFSDGTFRVSRLGVQNGGQPLTPLLTLLPQASAPMEPATSPEKRPEKTNPLEAGTVLAQVDPQQEKVVVGFVIQLNERNPDSLELPDHQVIGRVVEGLETARKIASQMEGDSEAKIKIQRAVRLN